MSVADTTITKEFLEALGVLENDEALPNSNSYRITLPEPKPKPKSS